MRCRRTRYVVAAHHPFLLEAEDVVEVHGAKRHEGGGGVGRRPSELGVEAGQEVLAQVGIRRALATSRAWGSSRGRV